MPRSHVGQPGIFEDRCIAIGCESPSDLVSLALPMCEQHIIAAYRQVNEYIRTKRGRAEENPGEPVSDLFPVQWEWVGRVFGYCPTCDYISLRRDRVTGEVRCANRPCEFVATREEFDALCQQRIDKKAALPEVVYYVRFGDRVKIGTTTNLASRIAAIPHDEVLATEPGGVYVEKQRHQQFKHIRTKVGNSREWFEMAPELIEHIAALKARQAAA